jgi:hypothetical protein
MDLEKKGDTLRRSVMKKAKEGRPAMGSAMKNLSPRKEQNVKGGTSVSNVLKLRHDTAKNSIANVR